MSYQCLLDATGPSQFIACLSIIEPKAWVAIFIGGIFLICGGWILGIGFSKGLAVGGFSVTIIALTLFLLDVINLGILLIPLIVMLLGVLLLILDINKS